jgi:hypothetical protein
VQKLLKQCVIALPVVWLLVGICGGAWSEWWMPGSLDKMYASGEIDRFIWQQSAICVWCGAPFMLLHVFFAAAVSCYLLLVNGLGLIGLFIGTSFLQ